MFSILTKNYCFVCKLLESGKSGAVVLDKDFNCKVAGMVGWWDATYSLKGFTSVGSITASRLKFAWTYWI